MSEKNAILWRPSADNAMQAFRKHIAARNAVSLENYADLYRYSVDHADKFWGQFVEYANIPFLKPATAVLERRDPWRFSRWFVGAEVNWAHMALASRRYAQNIALESFDENDARVRWSFAELYARVAGFAEILRAQGIRPRDPLAAFMPNTEETLVALLAAVACGATFSSTSPDFGVGAATDRLAQFAPRYLVAATHYFFKGKKISVVDKLLEIVGRVQSLEVLFVFRADEADLKRLQMGLRHVKILPVSVETTSAAEIHFEPYAFQDPLYVMYSSGTTGLPKCIVQGHGVVINHIKEHTLHCGSSERDRVFYYTTCGWMMYNWLVSALCFGATILLYDGNPFFPGPRMAGAPHGHGGPGAEEGPRMAGAPHGHGGPGAEEGPRMAGNEHGAAWLWNSIARRGCTVFGTSAKYLTTLMQHGFDAREITQKAEIRLILSTGSVLPEEGFEYVYAKVHPTAQLASISGGTDLNGCWALGNPDLPVRMGELQSRGLGMAVEIFNDVGESVIGEMGELVCTQPFPSMPLGFLGDSDGARYAASYFERFADRDVWAHGDFAALTDEGGMVFAGRSDATLNPGGVRIGTAEIYRVLDTLDFLEDSLIIGRPLGKDDEEVVLFVKLRAGSLSEQNIADIKKTVRDKVSPRHVPAKIFQVKDIPYTINGKKVELAVKYIALGRPVTNRETIANKEALAEYEEILR